MLAVQKLYDAISTYSAKKSKKETLDFYGGKRPQVKPPYMWANLAYNQWARSPGDLYVMYYKRDHKNRCFLLLHIYYYTFGVRTHNTYAFTDENDTDWDAATLRARRKFPFAQFVNPTDERDFLLRTLQSPCFVAVAFPQGRYYRIVSYQNVSTYAKVRRILMSDIPRGVRACQKMEDEIDELLRHYSRCHCMKDIITALEARQFELFQCYDPATPGGRRYMMKVLREAAEMH